MAKTQTGKIEKFLAVLNPDMVGWTNYFVLTEAKGYIPRFDRTVIETF